MVESHCIEFKETWRDEYLRQICGLANTKGGSLFVGVNDRGDVIGVANAKKLEEDIFRDTPGGLMLGMPAHPDTIDLQTGEILVEQNFKTPMLTYRTLYRTHYRTRSHSYIIIHIADMRILQRF